MSHLAYSGFFTRCRSALLSSWAAMLATCGFAANEVLFIQGDPVPGAGQPGSGIEANAVWTTLGQPSINDAGQIAFVGHWRPITTGNSALFVNGTAVLRVGDPVPGLAGATFRRLFDPVTDNLGHVALVAYIEGPEITTLNDKVIVSNGRSGAFEILARTGFAAPGTGGALFLSINNVSIKEGTGVTGGSESGIIILGSLKRGTGSPAATLLNDTGAWWLPSGGTEVRLLVREGDVGFLPRERIRAFRILKTIDASPGQGRGQSTGDQVLLQFSMNTGRHVLAIAEPGGLSEVVRTGDRLGGTTLPAGMFYKIGLPSSGVEGNNVSVFAMLRERVGGVTRAGTRGIFASADAGLSWDPVARSSMFAPGIDRARFFTFREPVQSTTSASVAFLATVNGRGILAGGNDGMWWQPAGGALTLIAREGDQVPGALAGVKWRLFNSLAMPGGNTGPLFTATLQANTAVGIDTSNDVGLYSADASGVVRELIREGQPLAGTNLTVASFTVLRAIVGLEGTTRSFNSTGTVALLVTFTDRSTAIVKLDASQ